MLPGFGPDFMTKGNEQESVRRLKGFTLVYRSLTIFL